MGLKMMTETVGPAQRNMDIGTNEPPNLLLPMCILMGETSICLVTRQAPEVILDSSPPHLTSQTSSILLSNYLQNLPLLSVYTIRTILSPRLLPTQPGGLCWSPPYRLNGFPKTSDLLPLTENLSVGSPLPWGPKRSSHKALCARGPDSELISCRSAYRPPRRRTSSHLRARAQDSNKAKEAILVGRRLSCGPRCLLWPP